MENEKCRAYSRELITTVHTYTPKLDRMNFERVAKKPPGGGWSKKEILGHLVDSAANNHRRFVIAQEADDAEYPAYDQEQWVRIQRYNDYDWKTLVVLWKMINYHLSYIIARIPDTALDNTVRNGGTLTHRDAPEPVTLDFLIADYIVHLKHHLERIFER